MPGFIVSGQTYTLVHCMDTSTLYGHKYCTVSLCCLSRRVGIVFVVLPLNVATGQLETVEMETGNGNWKWKTEMVKSSYKCILE